MVELENGETASETLVGVWATEAAGTVAVAGATVKCPGPDVEAHRLEVYEGLVVVHPGPQQETGWMLMINTARRLLSCELENGLQLSYVLVMRGLSASHQL